MAFNFQAYRNPYVSTIAELLSRGEDAKAKGLTDVANAQARAAEIRGQAFGGAAESVGKIASKALTDYTTEKQNAPIRAAEAEMRQQALAAGRDAEQLRKGQSFLSSAMADAPDPNYQRDAATGMSRYAGPPSPTYPGLYKDGPLGSKLLDPAAVRQLLVDNGQGANVEALMPIVDKQNARTSAMVAGKLKARGEYAEDAMRMMRAGTPWEQAVGFAGHSGTQNGVFTEKELSDLLDSGIGSTPAQQQAILFNIMRQGGAQTTFETPGQNEYVNGMATGGTTGAKLLTPAELEDQAFATPEAARTPAQTAIVAGVAERAAAVRPPATYGAPTSGVVNGREVFYRTTSDGKITDLNGTPWSGPVPTPVQQDAGRQPWTWVSRVGSDGLRTNVYTNAVRPTDGKVDPERPPTEAQSKAAGFYSVAADGLKTVEELEPKISAEELLAIQKLPLDGVAGYFAAPNISENAKRYLRAINQFIEAEVRDKSGAAVGREEYLIDKASYMLTQGETPMLAEDRRRSRRKVVDALATKAGPALGDNDLMAPPPAPVRRPSRPK